VIKQIEITEFDLRYESYRMKSKWAEKTLLNSILEYGIRDPLLGVNTSESYILLDGFKRYRCAKSLGLGILPCSSLGSDEALSIIELLRISNSKSLSILEQAKLIDELLTVHNMSNTDIARSLEKSKSWVSMRAGIIGEMSECVMGKIFSGDFPMYSYMYTIRQFMRMNCVPKKEVDEFVRSVSGKHLSLRDIELLAHGYFKGPEEIRRHIKNQNIMWVLSSIKEPSSCKTECSEFECGMIRDLEITGKYMSRVTCKSRDSRCKTNSFFSQANLLSGGILRQIEPFSKAIKDLYDRSGKA